MEKPRESLRLFESDFLERFSHVHPITPLLLWGPIVTLVIYRAIAVHLMSLTTLALIGVVALVIWSLFEYLLHRYVFHFEPTGHLGRRFVFIMHGNHHQDPEDATRLVMPPLPAIAIALPIFLLSVGGLGSVVGEPFFAFFIIGYLIYDYTHFSVHHFKQRTPIGKFLKQYHMLHHFVTPDARWGVSSPIWDYVFGTAVVSNAQQKSESEAAHRA